MVSACAVQCRVHDRRHTRLRGSRLWLHTTYSQCSVHPGLVFNKRPNHFHSPHDAQSRCYIITTFPSPWNPNLCCYPPIGRRDWPPFTNLWKDTHPRVTSHWYRRDSVFQPSIPSQSQHKRPSEEYVDMHQISHLIFYSLENILIRQTI